MNRFKTDTKEEFLEAKNGIIYDAACFF